MSIEAIASHIGLLNFAVAAILSAQSRREEASIEPSLGKIAFFLFVIAALAASFALSLALVKTEALVFELRGLILAVGVSWLSMLAYIWLHMAIITKFAAPLTTLLMLWQLLSAPPSIQDPRVSGGGNSFLAFHIAGAAMGQILALVACLVAMLFLWQRRVLKRKLWDQLAVRVPALDILAKVLMASLWAGFLFLTAALLSGAFYLYHFPIADYGAYLEKALWAITVWLWYLATLLAYKLFNLSVKRVAQMSLVGFVLLAMTFFGMAFFRG